MYSVLLNCKSAVSIRTVLRIPPVVAQWDRVFLVFPIVVINGMIFLLILRVATTDQESRSETLLWGRNIVLL